MLKQMTVTTRAHENAGELGQKLLSRIGAEQIAALQIDQQRGRGRRPRWR